VLAEWRCRGGVAATAADRHVPFGLPSPPERAIQARVGTSTPVEREVQTVELAQPAATVATKPSGVVYSVPRKAQHCLNTCAKVSRSAVLTEPPCDILAKGYVPHVCVPNQASDGICQEGRPKSTDGTPSDKGGLASRRLLAEDTVQPVLCDLGTDCSDCGLWHGTLPGGDGGVISPVEWLQREHNVSVFVRTTLTPRPFLAAITHHSAGEATARRGRACMHLSTLRADRSAHVPAQTPTCLQCCGTTAPWRAA
jgi:hypothetical protein